MIFILRVFKNFDYYKSYQRLKYAGNIKIKTSNFDLNFNTSFSIRKFLFKMYQTTELWLYFNNQGFNFA